MHGRLLINTRKRKGETIYPHSLEIYHHNTDRMVTYSIPIKFGDKTIIIASGLRTYRVPSFCGNAEEGILKFLWDRLLRR